MSRASRRPTVSAQTCEPSAEKWPSRISSLKSEQPDGPLAAFSRLRSPGSRWALTKRPPGSRNIDGTGIQRIGDRAGIVAAFPAAEHASTRRNRHEQVRPAPRLAKAHDLVEPVLSLVPIAASLVDLACLAEVVGEDAHDDELGPEAIGEGDERVIVLLGRVAENARVQDRDLGLEPVFEIAPQAFGRRVVVADEQALA